MMQPVSVLFFYRAMNRRRDDLQLSVLTDWFARSTTSSAIVNRSCKVGKINEKIKLEALVRAL